MKIAMIGQKGVPAHWGGVERHVEELSKVLSGAGHQVLVYARRWYTDDTGTKYIAPGITVITTPTIHSKHLDAVVHTITSTLHTLFQKPDIIHYHGVGPALFSWLPRIFSPRTTVVATFHCIDRYHKKWGRLARLILRLGEWAACTFPHQTIVVSKTIRDYCLNEYHRPTTYIPNGVQIKNTVPPETLTPFGLEPEKYVVMVSRLVAHKGAHYLLEAWQKAKTINSSLLNNYKLAIVGASTFTDNYVAELHTLAGTDPSIVFTGWQEGVALEALYEQAALLVHPSENEGLPLTVLEGMAHGRAVLLSDIAEHKELIDDPQELFATTNTTALAEKLIALLANTTLRSALGASNRRLVERYFSWKAIGQDTVAVYRRTDNQALRPAPSRAEA